MGDLVRTTSHLQNKALLDPLVQAALDGDVEFLKKVYKENINDLSSYFLRPVANGNFIHRAVKMNHYTFLSEALNMLPQDVVLELVCKTDKLEGSNPLHYAASEGNIFTVKLLVGAYVTAAAPLGIKGTPPWLTKNNNGNTPSRSCFMKKTKKSHENVARYLVSRDHQFLRTLGEQKYPTLPDQISTMALDKTGASLFFCAMREGFSLLAEQILTSGLSYSLSGTYGENPLHHASKCNEKVSRLLLERHSEFIGNQFCDGGTVLDRAVEANAIWLVKLMLIGDEAGIIQPWNKACRRLIWHINPNSFGDTPLHVAARKGYIEIAKLLVQGYESAIRDEAEEWDIAESHPMNDHLGVTPLHIENSLKDIPLFVALKEKRDDLGVYLLSVTTLNAGHPKDGKGNTAYAIAVENGCEKSSKTILNITVRHIGEDLLTWASNANDFHPSVFKIVQHFASRYAAMGEMSTSDGVVRLVVEGIPMFVKDKNKDAKSHLIKAVERKADWLVKLLLEGDNSLIIDSTPAWKIACEMGHLSTLLAFIEQCDHQEFLSLCQINQQTPLHHIKLPGCDEYRTLLANPVMQGFKNDLDSGGATPLHRAIERNYLHLTKALVETKGIKLDIEDLNHKTALDLLEEKCITNDNFLQLYKDLLTNPVMTQKLKNRVDNNGDTSLHRAIAQNVPRLAKALVETKGVKLEIKNHSDKTALDLIEERCCNTQSVNKDWYDLYKNLLENQEKLQMMKNRKGGSGTTPLHIAIEWNDLKLTKKLMQSKGIKLNNVNSNSKTPLDLIDERCDHIDSPWYELYKELLENPINMDELKNRKGVEERTPLHRAIYWDDITLAKTLLERKGVELNIKDMNGKTALDLLHERCYNTEKWDEMCREIRLDPSHKIFEFKYLQRRTSLKDMHNTLSVVAALLATITFAAGFTVPGGVDNVNGTATLGTKAAFLAFSITNTIAMCSSMLVLFTVIGAMIWEAHPNDTFLIDSCVFLLQFSLCGTIVAFMTGVYAIMAPKVMWAGIVVIVLCSLAFCGALFVISSFWPILYRPFNSLKKIACKLVCLLTCGICCGKQSETSQALGDPTVAALRHLNEQRSTTIVNNLVTRQFYDSPPSIVSGPPTKTQLSTNTKTQMMSGTSQIQTLAVSQFREPELPANTTSPVAQAHSGPTMAAVEHRQQQLQNTNSGITQTPKGPTMAGLEHSKQQLQNMNGKAGLSPDSQATGSDIKINISAP